jgi:hypothetical protein
VDTTTTMNSKMLIKMLESGGGQSVVARVAITFIRTRTSLGTSASRTPSQIWAKD